jgi:hypothetical protein
MLAHLRAHNERVSEFQQRVREHLADEEFDQRIEAFMRQHARRVAAGSEIVEAKRSAPMEGEFSLQAHDAYREYLRLSEEHWENFCVQESISRDELRRGLERMLDAKPKQGAGYGGFNANYGGVIMIKYMLAGWDFDKFVDRCKDWAEENAGGADDASPRNAARESKSSRQQKSGRFGLSESKRSSADGRRRAK